jgi:hypothetical protein
MLGHAPEVFDSEFDAEAKDAVYQDDVHDFRPPFEFIFTVRSLAVPGLSFARCFIGMTALSIFLPQFSRHVS